MDSSGQSWPEGSGQPLAGDSLRARCHLASLVGPARSPAKVGLIADPLGPVAPARGRSPVAPDWGQSAVALACLPCVASDGVDGCGLPWRCTASVCCHGQKHAEGDAQGHQALRGCRQRQLIPCIYSGSQQLRELEPAASSSVGESRQPVVHWVRADSQQLQWVRVGSQ